MKVLKSIAKRFGIKGKQSQDEQALNQIRNKLKSYKPCSGKANFSGTGGLSYSNASNSPSGNGNSNSSETLELQSSFPSIEFEVVEKSVS